MTNEQIKTVVQSLAETKKYLARESAYSLHLQNTKHVEFCKSHIAKLEQMLSDAWDNAFAANTAAQ